MSYAIPLRPDFQLWVSEHKPRIGLTMGSDSDWEPCMKYCSAMLEKLELFHEVGVTSAHRTPSRMTLYAQSAALRGLRVVIACAGGSAHLPGMVASETPLPVLGVAPKKGDDAALWSMVRMPSGVPLAFMGFDQAGAENAALYAARILAYGDASLEERLKAFTKEQAKGVPISPITE